jgi:hypothetical protein
MNNKSPLETCENWASEFVSIWGEIPNASDTCKHELASGANEGNMPEKGEEIKVPHISIIVNF